LSVRKLIKPTHTARDIKAPVAVNTNDLVNFNTE
jgi:hypothetical protein